MDYSNAWLCFFQNFDEFANGVHLTIRHVEGGEGSNPHGQSLTM